MATKTISPVPRFRFFNAAGEPLAGGQLFTYEAGTATKLATYTSQTGGAANTNPIVLDANGYCDCWLTPGLLYKFVLSPSTDTDPPTNPLWTVDNVSALGSNSPTLTAPTTKTVNYTTTADDHQRPIECSGTITITLLDATTATAGYQPIIVNVGSGLITVNLQTLTDTLNGTVSGSITVPPWTAVQFTTNNGAVGYEILYTSTPHRQAGPIASAVAINLDQNATASTLVGDYVEITGSTAISSVVLGAGAEKELRFSSTGAAIATTASLVGYPITTAAGDIVKVRGETAGLVRITGYNLANHRTAWRVGSQSSGKNISAVVSGTSTSILADELVLRDGSSATMVARNVSTVVNGMSTGVNGFDVSSIAASTWVYVHTIAKPDGTIAGLATTTQAGPTVMPSGYTFSALHTTLRAGTGTQFATCKQLGNEVYFTLEQSAILSGGNSTSEVAVTITSVVPPNALSYQLLVNGRAAFGVGADSDDNPTIRVVSGSNYWTQDVFSTTGGSPKNYQFAVQVPYTGNLYYAIPRGSTGGTAPSMNIKVASYKIPVGGE